MAGHRRTLWVAAAITVLVGVVAVWLLVGSPKTDRGTDCVIVEDVAQQWNSTAEQVSKTLLYGDGGAGQYRAIADQQDEIAQQLDAAADSVTSAEIKEQLTVWATGATEYAQLQRSVVDGGTDTARLDAEFQSVAEKMNAAAVRLGQMCPGMPSPQP